MDRALRLSGAVEYELKSGGAFRAKANAGMESMGVKGTIIDGQVLEIDPPKKLAQTYRFL